ncbi:MAG: hypothetical protein IJR60_03325 [Eubacterium sp.]|nr:hypothetical protein [Eubacterium sp.]
MSEKQIAKRYLLSVFLLYIVGVVLLTAFMFALRSRVETQRVTELQTVIAGLLLPLIPCVSYAGFVCAFLKVGELTKTQMVLIVVLFPLVLAVLMLYGAVMLVPSIISAVKTLLTTDH